MRTVLCLLFLLALRRTAGKMAELEAVEEGQRMSSTHIGSRCGRLKWHSAVVAEMAVEKDEVPAAPAAVCEGERAVCTCRWRQFPLTYRTPNVKERGKKEG